MRCVPEEDVEWTLVDYVWAASLHPAAPKWLKKLHEDMEKDGKKPVSEAYKRLNKNEAITHLASIYNGAESLSHPRFALQNLTVKSQVVLRPEQVTYSHGGEVKEIPILGGAIVPNSEEMKKAWTSDAVAYGATDCASSVRGAFKTNITAPALKALAMLPDAYSFKNVPSEFTNNPVENATMLYNTYGSKPGQDGSKQSPNGALYCIKHQAIIASTWEHAGEVRLEKVPAALVPYAKGNVLRVPDFAMPSTAVMKSDVGFYSALQSHRLIRGEDNGGLSPLTSGYYIASMPRPYDRVFWQTCDILAALYSLKRTRVVVKKGAIKAGVIEALAVNGIRVHVITDELMKQESHNVIYESVFSGKEAETVHYKPAVFGASKPCVTKKKVITSSHTEGEFTSFWQAFLKKSALPSITHVFLRSYMTKMSKNLMSSVHCHSGHVIASTIPFRTALDVPEEFGRMFLANKFKTAFPYRRVPFVMADAARPAFLLQKGFVFPRTGGMDIEVSVPNEISDYNAEMLATMRQVTKQYAAQVAISLSDAEKDAIAAIPDMCAKCHCVHDGPCSDMAGGLSGVSDEMAFAEDLNDDDFAFSDAMVAVGCDMGALNEKK